MGNTDALAARVRALQTQVDEAERFAAACRTAAARLRGTTATLSGLSVDVGGMRSRSAKVDRARETAESAVLAIRTTRSTLDDAVHDLGTIARKYEREADTARADLKVARAQLEASVLNGVG